MGRTMASQLIPHAPVLQLPNFLLAAPVLAVVVCAIWSYASANPFRFLTGGLVTRRRLGIRGDIPPPGVATTQTVCLCGTGCI